MGVPYQLVMGEKTAKNQTVELIKRIDQQKEVLKLNEIINKFKS